MNPTLLAYYNAFKLQVTQLLRGQAKLAYRKLTEKGGPLLGDGLVTARRP